MIADSIVDFVERLEGAGYVFGVPGSTTVSLINAISHSRTLKFISSLHENASLAMADGYSRASGNIGVVVLHTTPGLSTALPNLYNSFIDNVPLLIIVGDVNSKSLIRQPGLALDELKDLADPVTRWCYHARSPSDVLTAIERSGSILRSPQPGPCCVIVPEDILEEKKSNNNNHAVNSQVTLPPAVRTTITPDAHEISELVSMIDGAEWPLLIVGREVRSERSIRALVEFCSRLSVPVLLESPYPSAYDASFPQDNPCYLGLFRRESEAMKGADLIVGLGGQLFTERKFYEQAVFDPQKTRVVHIHSNPWELGKNIRTDVSIMGTPDVAALMLEKAVTDAGGGRRARGRQQQSRMQRIEQVHARRLKEREKLAAMKGGDGQGIKPWRLVSELYQVLSSSELREDFVIVDEGVVNSSYLSELFVFTTPGSLMGRSAGCLGWGVGAAIGAKLAKPEKKVIAFVGDGAFLFCPQALWTAAHYGIPVTVIVCNNSGYSSVALSYDGFGKRAGKTNPGEVLHTGVEILHPEVDITKLSEALGARSAVSVKREEELASALKKAIFASSSAPGVEVLNVRVDPSERGYEVSVGQNSAWT